MCVWYTQVMPQVGLPVSITLWETMEGIPMANRVLAGWLFNSVIAWFKVLLSLERQKG